MADFNFDVFVPRLSIYRAKMYAFLVPPREKNLPEDHWPLLDKNITLAREVGKNCLIQVIQV